MSEEISSIEFSRSAERYNTGDTAVVRVHSSDEEVEEPVALFYHDGSLQIPNEGETIRFEVMEGAGESAEIVNPTDEREYRVERKTHEYVLQEYVDDEGDEVDTMYGVVNIYVEGPIEAEEEEEE